MREPAPYDLVVSTAGHDKGKFFLVTGVQNGRVLLCDGKNRRMANPKGKSPKHVRVVRAGAPAPASDREIRKTIALAAQNAAAKEEVLLGER